jgi:NAD(P)H-hydrate epimerase
MFAPLPLPKQMAEWDRAAMQDVGIKPEVLMENASREAFSVLAELMNPAGARVLCIAGGGNNGGDAFAMARHLHEAGAEVVVLHTKAKREYKGEAGYNVRLAAKVGVEMRFGGSLDVIRDRHFDAVVDGLLGTGLAGPVREDALALIREINATFSRAFILAVDIPSGLNGETGRPSPDAVRADATVTFEAAKLGLVQPEAAPYVGDLHVRAIGIPRRAKELHPASHHMLMPEILRTLPPLSGDMHKGVAGHILVVGGASGLTGAPQLAALAALRAGAGLATVACPAGLLGEVKAGLPDVMALSLGEGRGWRPEMASELAGHLERFDAVIVGPGIGRAEQTTAFVREALAQSRPPAIIDADALWHMANDPAIADHVGPGDIITPHPGEAARLLDISIAEVQAERFVAVRRLVRETGAVAVLKGACTLVCDGGEHVMVSPWMEPNLAVAGSGDVLSGLLGRLVPQMETRLTAACAGVYIHGLAGSLLANEFPARGNLASEIADILPRAMQGE